jgi:hypothetical protein
MNKYIPITDPVELFKAHAEGKKIEWSWGGLSDGYYPFDCTCWHSQHKYRIVEELSDPVWPQEGDECWVVWGDGSIEKILFHNHTNNVLAQGNLFCTKKEVIAESNARAVIAEFQRQPGARKFDKLKINHYVVAREASETLYCSDSHSFCYGFASTYFDTAEQLNAAITAVGEDRILAAMKWRELEEC